MELSSSLALLPSVWSKQYTIPTLTDETHIWAIELRKSPPYQSQQFLWLSDREQSKSRQMRVETKRDYQIQARAWLRWLLAGYINSTPEQINYQYGPLGKPYLDSIHKHIYFNATDSNTILLCAFSSEHEMGLDVESTPRKVSFKRIAEKKYTPQEQAIISSLPSVNQANAFLAIWTRKEAFGKALGVGIRYPMKQQQLCENLNSYRHLVTGQDGDNWHLFQFNYENNIACLVSRQSHEKFRFYKLDIDSVNLQ